MRYVLTVCVHTFILFELYYLLHNVYIVCLGIKCPVCSKFVLPDEIEVHLVMCLTKPRLIYNGKSLQFCVRVYYVISLKLMHMCVI